jgi:hypothetical protein
MSDAAVWRVSWRRTRRTAAAVQSRSNRSEKCSGWYAWPSSRVKTWPVSVHAGPAAIRSFELRGAVAAQDRDQARVKVQGAATRVGLGYRLDDAAADGDAGAHDGGGTCVEVHVGPAESAISSRRGPRARSSDHAATSRSSAAARRKVRASSGVHDVIARLVAPGRSTVATTLRDT